jgi:tripartite-type tricarboxylate transporter receptor subunit TctC
MKRWKGTGIFFLLNLSLWLFSSFLYGTTFAAPIDFPKKEITVIVNFGPGGARDILARGVGKTMSKYLGVPMVVMNMPGAGGARGLLSLYNSAPDSHTIGVGLATDIIDQILEKRDYDNKKFTFIGNAQSSAAFIFVKSDSPLRSIKDFKTFGKPVRQAAFSLTAATTVAIMVMANREPFPLVIVGGYQSAAAGVLAVIRGEVEFCHAGLGVATSFVQSGQIRPILVAHQKRSPDFPDIPTIGEVGYRDLEALITGTWFMAPPGVPKDRMQVIEDALMKTLKDPEFLEWAKGAAVEVYPLSGEETTKMVFNLFGILERYKGDIEKYVKKGN